MAPTPLAITVIIAGWTKRGIWKAIRDDGEILASLVHEVVHLWQKAHDPYQEKKAKSKTRYACPSCGSKAWAKPGTELICGACYDGGDGETFDMEAEN